MKELPDITEVEIKEDYNLLITFKDGLTKKVNILPFIRNGVSSSLKDYGFFRKVKIENGYLTWPNGFDLCPEFMRNYA